MARNSRYDILFEPVRIGPVTAPNRFYQTPHAIGMGFAKPESAAALRGVKAEGGWGVVCTEYCSIHPSSDDAPYHYQSLWDDNDVRNMALTADTIHSHGSLAGLELWHGGGHTGNKMTREPLLAPSAAPCSVIQPASARAMDRADIKVFRDLHRAAAVRAMAADFDIVYVYADFSVVSDFLSRHHNYRSDEYGGSIENRTRLLREIIEDMKDAIGHRSAVAVRVSLELIQKNGRLTTEPEVQDAVAILAELPDLWDVNLSGKLGTDSRSSRFGDEGFQEEYVRFVKKVTTKPVVGVGRFTTPDAMVSQIKRGVLDFIGAARPSIADPFLPKKIAEGREDEIRECIGCNICRAANNQSVPLRCTQNPTMGEEWRRGWHPEMVPPAVTKARTLVVGSGPAGLECALTLSRRGYEVVLAEASRTLGGRVNHESKLPGLSKWGRVRDYRTYMLEKATNVEVYLESVLAAEDILEFGAEHVIVATGSSWRRDAVGNLSQEILALSQQSAILTPDDIFAGAEVKGPVLIYDDEHYAIGGALAERLRKEGHEVCLATPATLISSWAQYTDEQFFIQERLMRMGVKPFLSQRLVSVQDNVATFECVYTESVTAKEFGTCILVTGRIAKDALHFDLLNKQTAWADAGIKSVSRIGDCLAPSSIADAVFSGHRAARELEGAGNQPIVRRERPLVAIVAPEGQRSSGIGHTVEDPAL
jgi:dimethylamine/trimethylamine dehydrogenase